MTDAETIIITQRAWEVAKAVIMAVNEENRKQAIGAGHHNAAETIRLQTGDPSFR